MFFQIQTTHRRSLYVLATRIGLSPPRRRAPSLFGLRGRLGSEAHKRKVVEIDRNAPIDAACGEGKSAVYGGREGHHRVALADNLFDLPPDHFAHARRVNADINASPRLDQPDRNATAKPRRRVLR